MTKKTKEKLIKIGKLAKKANVTIATVRFYVLQGLLKSVALSPGKYRIFNEKESLKRIKEIKRLQKKRRLTIKEIQEYFN